MKRTHLLPVSVVLGLTLTGCQGMVAETTMQSETGNGIRMFAGEMQVNSATIVDGNLGSDRGAVSAVVVNNSQEVESLEGIWVDGQEAELSPGIVPIAPGTAVQVSTQSVVSAEVDLSANRGQFVEVQFAFGTNGVASELVLIVPPIGFYADYAPEGTDPDLEVREEAEAHGGEEEAEAEEAEAEEVEAEEEAAEVEEAPVEEEEAGAEG